MIFPLMSKEIKAKSNNLSTKVQIYYQNELIEEKQIEIDSLKEEFLLHWINISNIESPTYYKEGLDKVSEYIIEYSKKQNWNIEVLYLEKAGNCVCITMNYDSVEKPITISGHIDTVHPLGAFGKLPVKTEGDLIYGPGVTDCKGGVIAGLMAMKALKEINYVNRPIQLILQMQRFIHPKIPLLLRL